MEGSETMSDYEPLTIELSTKGNVEGITAILNATIEGIKNCKGEIRLVLKLKEVKA
jgi:hypothetical protein